MEENIDMKFSYIKSNKKNFLDFFKLELFFDIKGVLIDFKASCSIVSVMIKILRRNVKSRFKNYI